MLNYYKQYSRRTRIQDITNIFNGGMEYTDRPIEAGLTKTLVNFDVSIAGNYLKPRRGYEVLKNIKLVDSENNQLTIYDIVGHKEYNKASYVYFVTENNVEADLEGDARVEYWLYKVDVNSENPIAEKVIPDKQTIDTPNVLSLDFTEKEKHTVHGVETEPYKHWFFIEAFDGVYFRTKNGKYYVEKPFANSIENEGELITEIAQYRCVEVEAYTPGPAEINPTTGATSYNALLGKSMYTFEDRITNLSTSCNVNPLGLIAYEEDYKTPMTYHEPGKKVYYRCYYEFGKSYDGYTKVTVYMKSERENVFTKIHETIKMYYNWEVLSPIRFESVFSGENVVFKIEAANCTADGQILTEATVNNSTVYFSPRTIMAAVNIKELKYKSNYNLNAKTYSLDKAQGMTYWNNRIILWDTPEDNTVLFTSEVNNPSWFPYPIGVDNFEDKIIKAVPLLDTLLVFTKSKIYTLNVGPSGLGYTRSIIQSNLSIKEEDTDLIIPYKNMVFFKSGNYYYMIVPNTNTISNTGSLKIAPISNPIKELFDNFQNNVEHIIKDVYNIDISTEFPISLHSVKTYIDYEDIVVDYLFNIYGKDSEGKYKPCLLNFKLLYHTVNRVWKIYLIEANSTKIKPYIQNAIDRLGFLDIKDNNLIIVHTGVGCKDIHASELLPNYQLLNTGYHNVSNDQYPNVKKRFRELQLILDNPSYKTLKFYTEFSIDGYLRRERLKYQCVSRTQDDGKTYLIYEATPYMPEFYTGEVTGATILAEHKSDINSWTLDISEFPEQIAYKVRLPFTGKGYFPSLVLANYDQEDYELLSYVWVYRIMNAR